MNLQHITVTVLSKNSQFLLKKVLESLSFFGEVLLYDTGSTDETLAIAETFPNVTIVKAPFSGFGRAHNLATKAAKNDWILSIDSDEIASSKMVEEIAALEGDKNAVYTFPRHNYFNGKFIKWCGWHPDRQIRLYNRTKTRFSNAEVHEAIITDGMKVVQLSAPIIHFSYRSLSDFLIKMETYSTLFAKQYKGEKSSSPLKALLHAAFAFFKSYVIKRGFLGGYEGFVISKYNSHTAFYKYLKLYEANSEKDPFDGH